MLSRLIKLLRRIPLSRVDRSRTLSHIQVIIAATFLVGLTVLSIAAVRYVRSDAAKELVHRGETAAWMMSRAAGRALNERQSPGDAEAGLDEVIYDVRAQEGVEFAFVVDRNHRALAHSDGRKKGQILLADDLPAESPETRRPCPDDGFYYVTPRAGSMLYTFVRPIHLDARWRATYGGDLELHLGFILPGISSFAKAGAKQLLPGFAVAFILLIAGNYVAGLLVRPLKALKDETAAAAKATDDWQLDVEASGEVAEIARNWNRMVTTFRSSYQQVIETRRDLEVRNRVMLYEKRRTEAIVDSLGDGVIVTDADGKINFVNRESENLLGVSRSDAINCTPEEIVKDHGILQFLSSPAKGSEGGHDGSVAATGQTRKTQKRAADVEVARKNGTRHIRLTHVPVVDNNGDPGGAILTLRDITQEKLEERARKEFISSVTHELRAPLTSIKSYVEMLIDDEAKNPELQRDFFNTINEEADRLARLINDMLNMSKIEVGNLVLNKSLVRTRKLVEDAVNGLRSAANGKSIELSANVAANLPDVEADKELVRVVITNLLSNGIKYTPEGGRVFLTAETAEGRASDGNGVITIAVEDNGPGIPEDELDKIFERFYRGRSTAGQKTAGNGLGLALAREIATLHGGDIKVTSTVGQGSKFTFLLPAAATSRKVS